MGAARIAHAIRGASWDEASWVLSKQRGDLHTLACHPSGRVVVVVDVEREKPDLRLHLAERRVVDAVRPSPCRAQRDGRPPSDE